MTDENKRKRGKEFLMLGLKTLIFSLLVFFQLNQPSVYGHYRWLPVITSALIIFLGPSILASFIRQVVIFGYLKKHGLKPDTQDNFILGINRILSILNTVFGVVAFMILLGIDPIKFLTSITIVAAAIAVTFKDYITNMINGLIIMFSDRLSLGDHIRVNDHEGKILDITLINMILQNEDNDMVIIPNSVLFSGVIVNQSKQNVKKLSIEFDLPLQLGHTPEALEASLQEAIAAYKDQVVAGGLTVKTLAIHKDTASFKVQVLLRNYDRIKEREIRRVINTALLRLAFTPQA